MRPVLALASVAVVIGTAAPVNADTNHTDLTFLVALQQAGLNNLNPERAVEIGKEVCNMAGDGKTGADIVKNLQDDNPGLAGDGAAKFTAIAASAYCPESLSPRGQPTAPKGGAS